MINRVVQFLSFIFLGAIFGVNQAGFIGDQKAWKEGEAGEGVRDTHHPSGRIQGKDADLRGR